MQVPECFFYKQRTLLHSTHTHSIKLYSKTYLLIIIVCKVVCNLLLKEQ